MPLVQILAVLLLSAMALRGQSSPLILEHADSLAAQRRAGFLLLQGGVRFKHDSISFRTQRAIWNRSFDLVTCEGGFDFRHPRGNIRASSGSYARVQEMATAIGNVVARDSNGEAAYFGERLIYDRKKQFLTLPEKPVLHQYERRANGEVDTLEIRARHITYDQNRRIAVASGAVRITRDEMVVTCDSGFYDREKGQLALRGNPRCELKGYVLTGDSMFIELDGEALKSVLVVRNAHGRQDEDPGNNRPIQHSEVQGDTLFVKFKNKKAERLYVNNSARGLFYESDLADFVNKMNGDRLDIWFENGQMRSAVVQGEARSSYYYATPERKISGLNVSAGDTIHVSFDSNQVRRLKVAGNMATGIYYDLSKGPAPRAPGSEGLSAPRSPVLKPRSNGENSGSDGSASADDKARSRSEMLRQKVEEARRRKGSQ